MDTLSHNWHQNGFNEVVDVNAVFFTDSLELAVNGRVNLEANVLPIEHGLGVLGGQSSRIYFDVAVAEVANVEVFAHAATRSFSSGWRAAIICDTTPRTWLATDVLSFSGHMYTAWTDVYPMALAAFFGDPPSRSIASCLFIATL